jgi:hypothetical protein
LVHYINETSKVQGLENGTKDRGNPPPSERGCGSIKETVISLANIIGRD